MVLNNLSLIEGERYSGMSRLYRVQGVSRHQVLGFDETKQNI